MQHKYKDVHRIGVISDTHGLMRPEAIEALKGSDLIIHAGDIGSQEIIDTLTKLAPVVAIRGNNDRERWASHFPETVTVDLDGCLIYVLHNVHELDRDPEVSGFSVVIAGHSHKPSIERHGNVLFLNPGSAGPRRFTLPIAVSVLRMEEHKFLPEIIELKV